MPSIYVWVLAFIFLVEIEIAKAAFLRNTRLTATTKKDPEAKGRENVHLTCPYGSIQVGEINSGVSGCGLSCGDDEERSDRFNSSRSISECLQSCESYPNGMCKSFTWSPVGGNSNHMKETVCTLYQTNMKNETQGPNQIMCERNLARTEQEKYVMYMDEKLEKEEIESEKMDQHLAPTPASSFGGLGNSLVTRTNRVGSCCSGSSFDDIHEPWLYGKITKIELNYYASVIRFIGITYASGKSYSHGKKYSYGSTHIFNLGENQHIVKVSGRNSAAYIRQLAFETNDGEILGPVGVSSGYSSFSFDFGDEVLLYIFGRADSSNALHALGFAHISLSTTPGPTISLQPSSKPSSQPTGYPTISPKPSFSFRPSVIPSDLPSISPSLRPSLSHSNIPSISVQPTVLPSILPSVIPSLSIQPSISPSVSFQPSDPTHIIRTAMVGGTDGDPFDHRHYPFEYGKIVQIEVYWYSYTSYVRHISIKYENGQQFGQGRKEGNRHEIINLNADEYIVAVSGRYNNYIHQITFQTSDGITYGPYGDSGGSPFNFDFGGNVLMYIFGRSGWWMDKIGFAHRPLDSSSPSSVSSMVPSIQTSEQPSSKPSGSLSSMPSLILSSSPSSVTSMAPSVQTSKQPSSNPSGSLSSMPSLMLSSSPSSVSSMAPSVQKSKQPSNTPSSTPSSLSSIKHSNEPSPMESLSPSTVLSQAETTHRVYKDASIEIETSSREESQVADTVQHTLTKVIQDFLEQDEENYQDEHVQESTAIEVIDTQCTGIFCSVLFTIFSEVKCPDGICNDENIQSMQESFSTWTGDKIYDVTAGDEADYYLTVFKTYANDMGYNSLEDVQSIQPTSGFIDIQEEGCGGDSAFVVWLSYWFENLVLNPPNPLPSPIPGCDGGFGGWLSYVFDNIIPDLPQNEDCGCCCGCGFGGWLSHVFENIIPNLPNPVPTPSPIVEEGEQEEDEDCCCGCGFGGWLSHVFENIIPNPSEPVPTSSPIVEEGEQEEDEDCCCGCGFGGWLSHIIENIIPNPSEPVPTPSPIVEEGEQEENEDCCCGCGFGGWLSYVFDNIIPNPSEPVPTPSPIVEEGEQEENEDCCCGCGFGGWFSHVFEALNITDIPNPLPTSPTPAPGPIVGESECCGDDFYGWLSFWFGSK